MKTQAEKDSLIAKLCGDDGDGPVVLTTAERALLQSWFLDINQRNIRLNSKAQRVGGSAQPFNALRVTHQARDDGSEGFDLGGRAEHRERHCELTTRRKKISHRWKVF